MNDLGITRKALTVLYELNQVLKRCYTEFITLPGDFVIGSERNVTQFTLYDISYSPLVSKVFDLFGLPISVKTESLFQLFRDHKMAIETVAEKEGILYAIVKDIDPIEFGALIYEPSDHMKLGMDACTHITSLEFNPIPASDIDELVVTDLLTVEDGNMKVRLVRKIFPHLGTKGGDVAISFFGEESKTFKIACKMTVHNKQTKTDVDLYHVFKCFKF